MRILLAPFCAIFMGCVSTPAIRCGEGQQPATADTLYFGTSAAKSRVVSPEAWTEFLKNEITPRFPQGLTWWEASGQWRDQSGTIVPEATYVLVITHVADAASEQAVHAIMLRYKVRFRQEAVLRVQGAACVSF